MRNGAFFFDVVAKLGTINSRYFSTYLHTLNVPNQTKRNKNKKRIRSSSDLLSNMIYCKIKDILVRLCILIYVYFILGPFDIDSIWFTNTPSFVINFSIIEEILYIIQHDQRRSVGGGGQGDVALQVI